MNKSIILPIEMEPWDWMMSNIVVWFAKQVCGL